MIPTNRLNDPGNGLDGNGRRVLTYADLRATQPGNDPRPPSKGQTEGQITKIKLVKRQMSGQAGLDLLRARLVVPLLRAD
jgi:hypothetical protein